MIYSSPTFTWGERSSVQILRSLLFVPGNRAAMLDKAVALRPDAVVPDMEDSVPIAEKANARGLVASVLPKLAESGHQVIPRVNGLQTGLIDEDLAAVIGPHISGVSVGKVGDADEVRRIADKVARAEAASGVSFGSIALVLWVETARAIVNALSICTASKRVAAIAFGAEDFTNDMAVPKTEFGQEIAYPRSVVAVTARAAGVLALDTPYFNYTNEEGLRQDSIASRNLGFRGRFAIHPSQIEAINASYLPSEAETEQARRVIAAFEEAESRGSAATSLDGKVIDVPVVERARKMLAVAQSASD